MFEEYVVNYLTNKVLQVNIRIRILGEGSLSDPTAPPQPSPL